MTRVTGSGCPFQCHPFRANGLSSIEASRCAGPSYTASAPAFSRSARAMPPHSTATHRTPARLVQYATSARDRGLKVIIAGAGGAAHLPGMAASMTPLPVLGVPVESHALKGMDSLLSIVQMPGGVPVGTLAIGKAGAINAGLLAASILALADPALAQRLDAWRAAQTEGVPETPQ